MPAQRCRKATGRTRKATVKLPLAGRKNLGVGADSHICKFRDALRSPDVGITDKSIALGTSVGEEMLDVSRRQATK
jgi:hypothetical protein